MGFNSIREGYYLVPVSDLETLLSLNNLSSKNRVTTLNVIVRRIDENKRRVNMKTTYTTGLVEHALTGLSKVTTCQYEFSFMDEEINIEPLD